jgi:TorA maturation chaperone TorD
VELEFLYLLVFRENEARRLGDAAALATALALQHRFLAQHIGRWVQAFGTAIRENAQTAFYRDLAALTEQVVMRELADAEARAVP